MDLCNLFAEKAEYYLWFNTNMLEVTMDDQPNAKINLAQKIDNANAGLHNKKALISSYYQPARRFTRGLRLKCNTANCIVNQ